QGLDDAEEFSTVILRNERTSMDLAKVKAELLAAAKGMIARNPEIDPIVQECTDLPPYAHALQAELNRPVFDIITLSEMVHRAVLRMPFPGFIT
ncbi:MAG: aspartate/glutamate racemase family protein, partial [Leisingera sp.]